MPCPYGWCLRNVFSRLRKFREPVSPTLPEGSLPLYCPLVLGGREACLGGGAVRGVVSHPAPFYTPPYGGGQGGASPNGQEGSVGRHSEQPSNDWKQVA